MQLTDSAHFFIIYPVGLEDLGLIELEHKFATHFPDDHLLVLKTIPGGIEISCSVESGFLLNTILRAPTRILLRLAEFKCRDFPKLFQKMSRFPWSTWMLGQTPEVECASKNSRLFDSRKIEKAIQDGVVEYYRRQPVRKKFLDHKEEILPAQMPKIYFRVEDDECTLSLDTTGERLHLRGEKLLTGHAPIRENLAALLLIELKKHTHKKHVTLIDPMCGSGTFLLEAKNTNDITSDRDFAFKHTPLYIDNIVKLKKLTKIEDTFYEKLIGFDIDKTIVEMALTNTEDIAIKVEDLFSEGEHPEHHPIVIINPPYGIRVGENIDLNFYLKTIEAIKNKFHPEYCGIIIPKDYKLPASFRPRSVRPFKNGGIDVVFYVLGFK